MFQAGVEARGIQGAIDLPARAARLDKTGTTQLAQMPGDERLADAEYIRQIGDGYLLVAGQVIDDDEAGEVAQGLQGRLQFAPIVHSVAHTPARRINKTFINLCLYSTLWERQKQGGWGIIGYPLIDWITLR